MHDLWSTVAKSSIMAGWAWSPLIYQAFERNREVISPEETDSLPLLTLHLRRGDYADHCLKLAEWDSTYTGQSSFPEFEERDAFITPKVIKGYSNDSTPQPGDPPIVSSQDEKVKYYARHCYPDIRQVVERVREVVHDYNRSFGIIKIPLLLLAIGVFKNMRIGDRKNGRRRGGVVVVIKDENRLGINR